MSNPALEGGILDYRAITLGLCPEWKDSYKWQIPMPGDFTGQVPVHPRARGILNTKNLELHQWKDETYYEQGMTRKDGDRYYLCINMVYKKKGNKRPSENTRDWQPMRMDINGHLWVIEGDVK